MRGWYDRAVLRSSELTASAERRIGKCLKAKWRLDALIGLGGTAAVYAATHRNGSRVAIKILHRHLCASEHQVRRFLQEAYTANLVGHSGAVRVHDDDGDGEDAFLVMELLEGVSLKEHAEANGGRLSVEETIGLADQLLDVLEEAHQRGIVHRDIKPSNLFLTRSGALKVLDFGVARSSMPLPDGQTTADGDVIGTPAFMAPEQARGRSGEVTERADVWGVGATLFTLLSGELVHPATTATEHLCLTMSASARSLSSVRPDLPASLGAVIDRCLLYAPEQRWPSVAALRAALRALALSNGPRSLERSSPELDPLATATLPVANPERKPRAWGILASAAVLTIAVALAAFAPNRDDAKARFSKPADTTHRRTMALTKSAERTEKALAPMASSSRSKETRTSRPSASGTSRPLEIRDAVPAAVPSARRSSGPRARGAPAKIREASASGRVQPQPASVEKGHSDNPLDWRH
jgi:eukaryotic-like serine/threonine-protein kinase